jgi:hypothetical protein
VEITKDFKDLEALRVLISDKTGIPLKRCRLYSLFNEPADSLETLIYSKDGENYYAGYANKEPGTSQVVWVVDSNGYRDVLLRD